MKRFLFSVILLPALAMNSLSADVTFRSGTRQVALLELYTSEGCSSCPPAEAWLSGLKDSPRLWKDFVPVAFHVDYWDHLGWRDPWGAGEFSDRQRAYSARWNSDTIYTPEFVLNGAEWKSRLAGGFEPRSPVENAGILTVHSRDASRWDVNFTMTGEFDVHAALLVCGVGSQVRAGENRGLHLKHDFVVLKLADGKLARHGDSAQGDFILDSPRRGAGTNSALAVWVTPVNRLEPVQAVGGWLPPVEAAR